MVGVPGKYKGCETCRRRRVKCDNTRPLCRKCLDNGRECEGYERERVFITSTPKDGGRCSSHPPRQSGGSSSGGGGGSSSSSSSRKKAKSHSPVAEKPPVLLVQDQPLGSAWEDIITLSDRSGARHFVQIVALRTSLQSVARVHRGDGTFAFQSAPYLLPETGHGQTHGSPDVRGRCVANVPPGLAVDPDSGNFCIFLYEHGPFGPTWSSSASGVRARGPQAFQTFPTHQFFARIYRPAVISAAMLSRRGTFLASQEWAVAPWKYHDKSMLDGLLDIAAVLPSIFERRDQIAAEPPSHLQQQRAQNLLASCLHVEAQLDEWYAAFTMGTEANECWLLGPDIEVPFGGSLVFRDGVSATAFIYYWMTLLLFHRCVDGLLRGDGPLGTYGGAGYHDDGTTVGGYGGGGFMVDEFKYQQGRDLAGKICRSLDFALSNTLQPDLLVAPLTAAEQFFRALNEDTTEGTLELLWCGEFRGRLARRNQALSGLLLGGDWRELAQF